MCVVGLDNKICNNKYANFVELIGGKYVNFNTTIIYIKYYRLN